MKLLVSHICNDEIDGMAGNINLFFRGKFIISTKIEIRCIFGWAAKAGEQKSEIINFPQIKVSTYSIFPAISCVILIKLL